MDVVRMGDDCCFLMASSALTVLWTGWLCLGFAWGVQVSSINPLTLHSTTLACFGDARYDKILFTAFWEWPQDYGCRLVELLTLAASGLSLYICAYV